MRFSRLIPLFALLALVASPGLVLADTVVELLGRVNDNGFPYYSTRTPWSGARVGEYFYTSFKVTGAGLDITIPEDHQIQPLVQANVFNVVAGSFTARLSDIEISIPVGMVTDPNLGPISSPAALLAHYYYQVDTFDQEGVFIPWAIGSCCFPDGSCQVFTNAQCGYGVATGVWTMNGTCDVNPCAQPSGVCCASDDTCSITTLANCSFTWSTGGSCTPGVSCPQSPGSCCSANGSCAITSQAQCSDPSQLWTEASACDPNPCQVGIIPGYSMDTEMSHSIPRIPNPPVAWNSADFASNLGTYPGSLFDNDRSWLISFVGTDHNSYEMFINVQKMVFSDDTTPTGACCPGDGHCFVGTQAACPTGAPWASAGGCSPSPCSTSSGACCYADGSCDLVTPAACSSAANSVYQGDGTACALSTCGSPGACCSGGGCTLVLQGACLASGGSWLGAGTICTTLPQHNAVFSETSGTCCNGSVCTVYPDVALCSTTGAVWTPNATCIATICGGDGACCNTSSGVCVMASNSNGCTGGLGGTWMPGTTCVPSPCGIVGPCCASVDGTCIIENQSTCLSASGVHTWSGTGTCANFCSAGACCNNTSALCSVVTQAFCTGTWTAGVACDTACTIPVAVVDGPNTSPRDFPITVTDSGNVTAVEVWVNINMSSAVNLDVQLVSPSGVAIDLVNRVGASNCTSNFVGASAQLFGLYDFLDSAPQSIAAYLGSQTIAAPPGQYKAAGCGGSAVSLNASFAGQPIAGTWKLRLTNYRTNIYAYLTSWSISFNGGNPAPCTVGHCNLLSGCTASTFAQCTGSWSIGPCTITGCSTGTPGACCYLNSCSVICQSLCPSAASGGRFAGFGTACTPTVCNVACCQSSGVCSISTVANCAGVAGAFGSTCSGNPCPQPAACCQPGGACTMALASVCTSGGGTVGSSTCTPNTCPGQAPAPPNDDCATVLAGGGGPTAEIFLSNGVATINDTLVGATSDGVTPSCGQPADDVWYRFTPTDTASYIINTCGSNRTWDSLVSVWSSCTTQVPGACGDTGCSSSNHASLTFTLTAGTPYLVRVSAFSLSTPNIDTFRLVVAAQGACCGGSSVCPQTGICYITDPVNCQNGLGTFQGFNTTCQPNPCPQLLGICCLPSLQCLTTCQENCEGQGGTFGGAGSACGGVNPCPLGVCCRGATCATGIGQINCDGPNTIYLTNSAICNASHVGNTPCCHADYNKNGSITVQDIFSFLSDWFRGSPYANVGGDGNPAPLRVQNIFDFLSEWFAGGC